MPVLMALLLLLFNENYALGAVLGKPIEVGIISPFYS